MKVTTLKRVALPLIGAAMMLGLAACDNAGTAPADKAEAAAGEALSVTNARLVLSPVAGNPAAVYFDLSYAGAAGLTLSSVNVEGAGMSMIHDYAESAGKMQMMEAKPVALTAGAEVSFAPGGLHVMAMQPSDAWKPGGMVKITLALSDGSTQSFDAPVRAAGEER